MELEITYNHEENNLRKALGSKAEKDYHTLHEQIADMVSTGASYSKMMEAAVKEADNIGDLLSEVFNIGRFIEHHIPSTSEPLTLGETLRGLPEGSRSFGRIIFFEVPVPDNTLYVFGSTVEVEGCAISLTSPEKLNLIKQSFNCALGMAKDYEETKIAEAAKKLPTEAPPQKNGGPQ